MSAMTGHCRSREVSDRSKLMVARSCKVVTLVPEERGQLVVDSTTTAANVSSTSSALCRLDNLHYDFPNLSVTVKKLAVDCVQRLVYVDFIVQSKSVFSPRILQFRRHGPERCEFFMPRHRLDFTHGRCVINFADVEERSTPPVEVPRRTSVTKFTGALYSRVVKIARFLRSINRH